MTRPLLRFFYRDAKGNERTHTLRSWAERGPRIIGFCIEHGHLEFFYKARVIEYYDGGEALLVEPNTPMPDKPPSKPKVSKPYETGQAIEADEDENRKSSILFTCFNAETRAVLEKKAEEGGLAVKRTGGVTVDLTLLCVGTSRLSTSKLPKAQAYGVCILTEADFYRLIETSELPR